MDWKSEPLITRNQRSRLLSFVFLIFLDTSQLLHYSSFRHSHLLSLSLLKSHLFYSLEYSFTSPLVWQISSPFCSHLTKLTLFYFIFSTNLLSFFLVHNLANLLSLSCVFLFFRLIILSSWIIVSKSRHVLTGEGTNLLLYHQETSSTALTLTLAVPPLNTTTVRPLYLSLSIYSLCFELISLF